MNALLTALARIYLSEPVRHEALREVVFAQWMLESGRGTSDLAKLHYNFAGLKWRKEMAGWAVPVSYEAHDGKDTYCKFPTLEHFVSGYWAFLGRAPYSGWEEHAEDPADFIRFVGPTYATTANYADKVLALLPEAKVFLAGVGVGTTAALDLPLLGTIVIDPGHGGESVIGGSSPNNAISASGVKEKKLTLDVALMLVEHLHLQAEARGGRVSVALTRNTDKNVGIANRAGLAKQTGADLFLSLHFNGADGKVRGTETYYRAAANGNVNLAADTAFAQRIQSACLAGLTAAGLTVKDRKVKPDTDAKAGSIGVLRDDFLGNTVASAPCLACLLEMEFIDNPSVDRALVSGASAVVARAAVAEHLAGALLEQLTL